MDDVTGPIGGWWRTVPENISGGDRLAPSPGLLRRARERSTLVVGDIAGRREEVGLMNHLEPRRIDRADVLDVFRLER
jgi:hypothetical protein